jgi:2-C-methyl-D-erythritol 2,4-cyclodiphosphate synthase
LRTVIELLHHLGYRLSNLDATIIAQAPKMAPHIDEMRLNIASDCDVPVDRINIKATTTEMLGFEGRGEGIAAQAVCLLAKKS